MPFGKYSTFDDCVQDQLKDHDEEEAKRICGALQKQLEGSVNTPQNKAVSYEENDRLYLKIFLLDGSVNMNDWGVAPSSIARNIPTAIGKPVVLYKNAHGEYDHPSLAGQDSLDHALAYQDLYRIGTYIDVFESQTKPGQWWGVAEVTDEGVKKAIREDPSIPFYVSPTIRLLHPNQSDQSLTEWAFMHSAVVDKPAYTTQKAYISGHCSGNSNTCLLQLRRASINHNNNEGKPGCGFCTYEATKQIQNHIVNSISSYHSNSEQLQNRHKFMANSNNENRNSSVSETNQQEPSTTNNNNNQQNVTQVEQKEQQKETTKVVKQVGNGNGGNGNSDNDNKDKEDERNKQEGENKQQNKQASTQELLETIQRQATVIEDQKLKLQSANATVDSLKSLNAQYNDRIARVEEDLEKRTKAERLNAITDIVQRSAIYQSLSSEDKQKQIETFNASGMEIEQIKNFITPLEASFKKASMGFVSASYTPRLTLGGSNKAATTAVGETRSASNNTAVTKSDGLPANLRLHQFYGPGNEGGIQ